MANFLMQINVCQTESTFHPKNSIYFLAVIDEKKWGKKQKSFLIYNYFFPKSRIQLDIFSS